MRRFTRLAALAFVTLGLVPTSVPPASAQTTSTIVITGTFLLGSPIGNMGTSTVTDPGLPLPLVPPEQHCGLPLPGLVPDPVPQCHINPGGHTRALLDFIASACATDVVNVNKPDKAPAHVGVCSFSDLPGKAPEGNHVHGFCDLMGGQDQILFTDALGQSYTLDIHFTGVGTNMVVATSTRLVLLGHWRKLSTSQTGLLEGTVTMTAVPDNSTVPPGNSCAANTAMWFTFAGTVTLRPHV